MAGTRKSQYERLLEARGAQDPDADIINARTAGGGALREAGVNPQGVGLLQTLIMPAAQAASEAMPDFSRDELRSAAGQAAAPHMPSHPTGILDALRTLFRDEPQKMPAKPLLMPNQPRKPQETRPTGPMSQGFDPNNPELNPNQSMKVIPDFQNPLKEKMPTPDEMGLASVQAVRPTAASMEQRAQAMQPKPQGQNGAIPQFGQFNMPDMGPEMPPSMPGMDQLYQSDNPFMGQMWNNSQDVQQAPAPQPGTRSIPYQTPQRPENPYSAQIEEYLASDQDPNSERNRDIDMMNQAQNIMRSGNRDLAFTNLLSRAAAKMGTINGKMADTTAMQGFTDSLMKGNENYLNMLKDMSKTRQNARDDKLKGMQGLHKSFEDRLASAENNDRMNRQMAQQWDIAGMNNATARERNEQMHELNTQNSFANNDIRRMQVEGQLGQNQFNRDNWGKMTPLQQAQIKLLEAQASKALKDSQQPAKTKKSAFMEQADKDAGKTYAAWISDGGRATVRNNINNLKQLKREIENDVKAGGSIVGQSPEWFRTMINDKSPVYSNRIRSAIQDSFKATYGAQFTEKEGENLIKTGYDPTQTPQENAKRVQAVIDKIEAKYRATDEAMNYLRENETLSNYSPSQDSQQMTMPEERVTPSKKAPKGVIVQKGKGKYKGQTRYIYPDGKVEIRYGE